MSDPAAKSLSDACTHCFHLEPDPHCHKQVGYNKKSVWKCCRCGLYDWHGDEQLRADLRNRFVA